MLYALSSGKVRDFFRLESDNPVNGDVRLRQLFIVFSVESVGSCYIITTITAAVVRRVMSLQ